MLHLTPKQLEMHRCGISTVPTDVFVPKHQTISNHSVNFLWHLVWFWYSLVNWRWIFLLYFNTLCKFCLSVFISQMALLFLVFCSTIFHRHSLHYFLLIFIYHSRIILEQLERLRSENTPRRPMITHTIDQFILNPNSILLISSYPIPSQKKVKAVKIAKIEILEFCYKLSTGHTLKW